MRYIESLLRLIRAVEPDAESAARQFRAMGYYLVGADWKKRQAMRAGRRRPNP